MEIAHRSPQYFFLLLGETIPSDVAMPFSNSILEDDDSIRESAVVCLRFRTAVGINNTEEQLCC